MRPLSRAQVRILESAMPALIARVVGLSGDALRKAMHPAWAQTVTDVLHEAGDCPCQHGKVCFMDLSATEQNQLFTADHDLSLEAFVQRYEEACRQALRDTPP